MHCPHCGTETPATHWNCVACRINLYWAHQHFAELTRVREQQGLRPQAATPAFLVASHRREMARRAQSGTQSDNKVREIARRTMQNQS